MKSLNKSWLLLLLIMLLANGLTSCKHDETPTPTPGSGSGSTTLPNTPSTPIPDELVGTWYAELNANPLTENWTNCTFQGADNTSEFRTMVFTKDGKNATEYTSEIFHGSNGELKQYLYKVTGTLEYKTNPTVLTFHGQSGVLRIFSNQYTGYREAPIVQKDIDAYYSSFFDPQATTFTSMPNFLSAKRTNGATQYSVRYKKVNATAPPSYNLPSTTPPTSGTYVKVGNLYYATVSIGDQEWTAVNYAGLGGVQESTKPQYGTFLDYSELANVPVPTGWHIPTKQDYLKLLQSQGLTLMPWDATDGDDVTSKRLLGQLMSATGWNKPDGFPNNRSGFNALPADVRRPRGTNYGEGSNCVLWTSTLDNGGHPLAFQIIQVGTSTQANFSPLPITAFPVLVPLRLVKDK